MNDPKYQDGSLTQAEARRMFVTDLLWLQAPRPQHEVFTCGRLGEGVIYVGTPCEPMAGKRFFAALMAAYPNHPCHRYHFEKNSTPTQEIYYQALQASKN